MVSLGCRGLLHGARGGWRSFRTPLRNVRRVSECRVVRACASNQTNGSKRNPDKYVVTTPLYYVNAAPHMGSAYPTIAADAVARYQRLKGKDVSFITGTDEHGEKIALAAESNGMEPQEHCDHIVSQYKALWSELDIQYDSFIRTSSERHGAFVSEVLERVWERGDIYLDQYEGWYCVDCEEYKDDGEMVDHCCSVHRKKCFFRKEENYFFRLSKYQKEIGELVINNDKFIQPASRRNEVAGWVKDGLRDFSISRVNVDWGVRIREDPKHTVYVWFDALTGYLSGLFPPGEAASLDKVQERGWPADVHIIGKDILRFHAVYWPAMLLSAGLPVPDSIFGHGFITKDGLKMGKSLGNVLDPYALVSAYGSDAVRYFFMQEFAFGQDGDFSEPRFRDVINSNLANDIGNLLNRTLNLLKKNCNSACPVSSGDISQDNPLRALATMKVTEVATGYERFNFSAGLAGVLSISGRGNQYLEETAPWAAFKKGSNGEKAYAGQVLVSVLEAVRIVAVMLSPVTPRLAQRIYIQLGFSEQDYQNLTWSDAYWGVLRSGHQVRAPKPVFKRIDDDCAFVTKSSEEPVTVA
ncbi:hypothetical protein BSKO_06597 [Bryopsis sp. KO-2023]|nr:hypothetical protein BSKO_06597 [Bryopsis sp. KO-2023]